MVAWIVRASMYHSVYERFGDWWIESRLVWCVNRLGGGGGPPCLAILHITNHAGPSVRAAILNLANSISLIF